MALYLKMTLSSPIMNDVFSLSENSSHSLCSGPLE